MKALILAAGYATRLYPLTKEYPKPLLEVKGKPIIDYIVEKLINISSVDEIYVVTNNKFIRKFSKWAKSVKSFKKITVVNDLTKSNSDRLGSVGDIEFVIKKKKIKDGLLVVGGDNLFNAPLKKFLEFSLEKNPAASLGLFKLKTKKDASRYGVVELNRRNKVVNFEEKPAHPKSRLVAMCLYYIPKGCLRLVADYMKHKKSDTSGGYIDWLKERIDVYGYVFSGTWFDIGDHKYLNAAKKNFAK